MKDSKKLKLDGQMMRIFVPSPKFVGDEEIMMRFSMPTDKLDHVKCFCISSVIVSQSWLCMK